jgi:hypothetical protein
MFAVVALVLFTVATIEAAFTTDWTWPWAIPAGLTALAAEMVWQVRQGTWRRR